LPARLGLVAPALRLDLARVDAAALRRDPLLRRGRGAARSPRAGAGDRPRLRRAPRPDPRPPLLPRPVPDPGGRTSLGALGTGSRANPPQAPCAKAPSPRVPGGDRVRVPVARGGAHGGSPRRLEPRSEDEGLPGGRLPALAGPLRRTSL